MKNIFTIISIVLFAINSIAGLVLSSYSSFNWISADIAITLSMILRQILNSSSASHGMKIGSNFILTFFALTSFVLAVVMPAYIQDNFIFILCLVSVSIQLLIAIVPKYFTSISNTNK